MMMVTRKRVDPDAKHPLLIALTGKERAGKTTAAKYLASRFNGNIVSFANSLKRSLYDLNAIRGGELKDFLEFASSRGRDFDLNALPRSPISNPTPDDKVDWINENKAAFGDLMQTYGDYKRNLDPNIFIHRTTSEISRIVEKGGYVILVDDCRFHNEVDALETLGFEAVRIQTSDAVRQERGACRAPDHASEIQLDSRYHPYTVFNNMHHNDLYRQLNTTVEQILNA